MNLNSLPAEVRCAVEAAQNKLAYGITVLDLRALGAFTNYFLICSGGSQRQAQAISEEIEQQLAAQKRKVAHREGRDLAQWVLLDYGTFVAHIFTEESRLFFDLERLWRSAQRLVVPGPGGAQAAR